MEILAYISTRDHKDGWFYSLAPLCGRDVLSLWGEWVKAQKGAKPGSTGDAELDAFNAWASSEDN